MKEHKRNIQFQPHDARRIITKLFSNVKFLTSKDLEVLDFLGKKGDHDDRDVNLYYKEGKKPINIK